MKDDTIELLKTENEGKDLELEMARKELQEKREMLEECDKKVEGMKTEKSKLQKRISYLNRKCSTKLEKVASFEENLEKIDYLEEK